jgi:hypothetical protein
MRVEMRRFLLGCSLVASGLVSLAVCLITTPILWAMREDMAVRDPEDQTLDDDDPGEDLDEEPYL